MKPFATTVNFLVISPLPRTRTPSQTFLRIPASTNAAGSTVAPSSKRFKEETFTSAYSFAKYFEAAFWQSTV